MPEVLVIEPVVVRDGRAVLVQVDHQTVIRLEPAACRALAQALVDAAQAAETDALLTWFLGQRLALAKDAIDRLVADFSAQRDRWMQPI